jgi:hypothetical protein
MLIVETCERIMDHWYIRGNRMPKYHACINVNGLGSGPWACGHSIEDALDSLVNAHKERFPNGRKSIDQVHYLGRLGR